MSCIIDGAEYAPGQTWSTDNGCTTYECIKQNDGTLSTNAIQETCPDITDCPEENLWQDQCCTKCNLTTLPMKRKHKHFSLDLLIIATCEAGHFVQKVLFLFQKYKCNDIFI